VDDIAVALDRAVRALADEDAASRMRGQPCSASAASHRFSPLSIRRGAITPGFRRFTIIPRVIGAAPGGYVIPMAITYFALATGKNASTATFAARNTRNLHFQKPVSSRRRADRQAAIAAIPTPLPVLPTHWRRRSGRP
jgi:hypothetical protein